MIFYDVEKKLEQHLLCKICLKICYIPISCLQCRCLYCFNCLDKLEYICQDCKSRVFKFKLDLYWNLFLNKIKCKCSYCYKYIYYQKYIDHVRVCKLLNNPNKFQLNFIIHKDDQKTTLPMFCQTCQIQIIYPYQCMQCQSYICCRCKNIEIKFSICCQKQQLIKAEDIEKKFNVKFSCKTCLIFVKHKDLRKHLKVCYNRQPENLRRIKFLKQEIENFDLTLTKQKSQIITNYLEKIECDKIAKKYSKRYNLMIQEKKMLKQKNLIKQEHVIKQEDIKQEDVKQECPIKQKETKQEDT